MKINKICGTAFFLSILVFLFSCSNENSANDILAISEKGMASKKATEQELTPQEAKLVLRLQKPSNRISIEEAIQKTNEFAASMHKTDSIISVYKKSDPSRTDRPIVKTELSKEIYSAYNVKVKSISAMRSSQIVKNREVKGIDIPDTLAYVFNFDDSAGFAIVSADERIGTPVLAFTTKGSFNRETDNPGMALFLKMLDAYLINSITEAEQQKDSLLNSIHNKLNTDDIANISPKAATTDCSTPGMCIERVGPLIEVKWGQLWPFNDSIPPASACSINNIVNNGILHHNYNPGGRYLTGCVATATTQIISYWRYPDLNGYFLNGMPMPGHFGWGYMVDKETKQDFYNMSATTGLGQAIKNWFIQAIGQVFAKIGTNVGMFYGCDGSSAYSQDALNYLSSLGFLVSSFGNYNYAQIKSYLSSGYYGRLVYTRGCDVEKGCHAWVIDGYMSITISNTGEQKFVYSNWGWDGRENGWFYENILNPSAFNFQNELEIAAVYRNNR